VDLTYDLRNCVLVERNDFAFFAGIDCENLLEFCNHCKYRGLHIANFKIIKFAKNSADNIHHSGKETTKKEQPSRAFLLLLI
jgi:hypothetical protein